MLTSGAVDIVLSKPLSRMQIYASKYVGGIFLYAAAIAAFCVLLYIGVGVRTGIFHLRIFYGIPLLMFSAMVLYAILALIGTASRSATLALVLGYVFYVVVDSLISAALTAQPLLEAAGWHSVAATIDVVRHVAAEFRPDERHGAGVAAQHAEIRVHAICRGVGLVAGMPGPGLLDIQAARLLSRALAPCLLRRHERAARITRQRRIFQHLHGKILRIGNLHIRDCAILAGHGLEPGLHEAGV